MSIFAEMWQNMTAVDCLRSLALFVAFLATAFADRKGDGSVWLKADQLSLAVFGVSLILFPGTLLAYVTSGKMDVVHQLSIQGLGLTMLACVAVWHYSSRSKEATASWALARLMSSLILVEVMFYSEWKYHGNAQKLSNRHHTFSTLGAVLCAVGHLMCTLRVYQAGMNRNTGNVFSKINLCLLGIVAFMTVDCVFGIARPHYFFEHITMQGFKMDGVHLHLARCSASFGFTILFYAFITLLYQTDFEKVCSFIGCLTIYVSFLPLLAYYQWKYNILETVFDNWLVGMAFVPISLAFYGCYVARQEGQ